MPDVTITVENGDVLADYGVTVRDGGQLVTVQTAGGSPTIPISDAGGSLTVDGTVAVSGTVTVSDGAGSLTVDGSVTADTELTTADLDTGAGTDTRAVVGLVLGASGGALLVGSANPMPVSDNAGSLTVDNAGTFAVQATLQAGSAAYGKLSVNDGVDIGDVTVNNAAGASAVNIQDGGNSITVDGTVSVSGSVAVTGPLTDTQLRATPVPTKETRAATPTQARTALTGANQTLIAANANRLGATIWNDSVNTLKVKLGATASATSFTATLQPDGYYEVPFAYTGIVDAFASAGTGNANTTELAA